MREVSVRNLNVDIGLKRVNSCRKTSLFFPFLLHSLITVSTERLLTSTCSANRLEILNIDITIFDGMINNL